MGQAARHDHHAKDLAGGPQRRAPYAAQSALSKTLWKRKRAAGDIRLIHQLPLDAPPQAIVIDGNARLLGQCQIQRNRSTEYPHTRDGQHLLRRIVEANTPEIDRQIVLEPPDDDLENTPQVLALTYG